MTFLNATVAIKAGFGAAMDADVKTFHSGWDTGLSFAIIALLLVLLIAGKQVKEQMTRLVEALWPHEACTSCDEYGRKTSAS
jgi:hypothetical protein